MTTKKKTEITEDLKEDLTEELPFSELPVKETETKQELVHKYVYFVDGTKAEIRAMDGMYFYLIGGTQYLRCNPNITGYDE